MAAAGTERSTMMLFGSTPSGSFSPPVPVMKRMPALTPPRASATARTGTPLQATQPAAPTVQAVPLGLLGKKPRPLPEHCSTMVTVSRPRVLSSRTLSLRGFFTPPTAISQASRSATMAASGAGRLLRR